MSVPSRKRWTLSVPRTRLSVNAGRSVSSPSAMLRAFRKSKKKKPFDHDVWRCGGWTGGSINSSNRIQSTILFSLKDWLSRWFDFVRDGYFHISKFGMGFGNREKCDASFFFSLFMREKKENGKTKNSFFYPKTMNGMALCVIRNFAEFFLFFFDLLHLFFPLNSSLPSKRQKRPSTSNQESPDD